MESVVQTTSFYFFFLSKAFRVVGVCFSLAAAATKYRCVPFKKFRAHDDESTDKKGCPKVSLILFVAPF
jgi:hypothetical protein